jgi:ABC-type microcin C transport system permease subunit YejB
MFGWVIVSMQTLPYLFFFKDDFYRLPGLTARICARLPQCLIVSYDNGSSLLPIIILLNGIGTTCFSSCCDKDLLFIRRPPA